MIYLAINLDKYHENKNSVNIIHIDCNNIERAKEHLKKYYPHTAWSIISEKIFNKNIVLKEI